MRVANSFRSSLFVVTLAVSACGGNAPAPATPAANGAEPPTAPEVTESSDKNAASDDEAWSGEKSDKTDASAVAAPSAEPGPANGKVTETRSMDVIRKLVMDHRKAARKCYEDARRESKDLKGDVVVHFVLDPQGKVKSAELNQERSTLKAAQVSDCVIAVIRSIDFPPSSRGMETSTNYPFNFTP